MAENNEAAGDYNVNIFYEDGEGYEFFGEFAEKNEGRKTVGPGESVYMIYRLSEPLTA